MYLLALVTVLCAPVGDQDADAVKVLKRVNFYREEAGLMPVTLDPQLSKACQLHAAYLVKNVNGPKDGSPHKENADLPGYTKEGEAAGLRAVIGFNPSNPSGPNIVDRFMSSFFHRIDFLRPDLQRIGFAEIQFDQKKYWTVLDARGGQEATAETNRVVAYPADKQTAVPLLFINAEVPNPIPPEGRKLRPGYPVTVTFPENSKVVEAKMSMCDGAGKEVPAYFSSPEKPAYTLLFQVNTLALIPQSALRPRTTFTVTATAKVDGKDWSKTWTFTTAAK